MRALQSVNAETLAAYRHIGREIVEEEQRGGRRAGYGERLIRHLAERLTAEFGKGFSKRTLEYIREFYRTHVDRAPRIAQTPSAQFGRFPAHSFHPGLSWSHYCVLLRLGAWLL